MLNQRNQSDPPPWPALVTLCCGLGTTGRVGGTMVVIGGADLQQTVAAAGLATAMGVEKGSTAMGQSAGPAIPPLLPAHFRAHPVQLLAVLPLLLLLNRRNRATLQKGWTWLLVTTGALVEPLRTRRHVIHDRRYLDQMLDAEFGPDREAGPERSTRRSSPPRNG